MRGEGNGRGGRSGTRAEEEEEVVHTRLFRKRENLCWWLAGECQRGGQNLGLSHQVLLVAPSTTQTDGQATQDLG